jgi:hypothetical protein
VKGGGRVFEIPADELVQFPGEREIQNVRFEIVVAIGKRQRLCIAYASARPLADDIWVWPALPSSSECWTISWVNLEMKSGKGNFTASRRKS